RRVRHPAAGARPQDPEPRAVVRDRGRRGLHRVERSHGGPPQLNRPQRPVSRPTSAAITAPIPTPVAAPTPHPTPIPTFTLRAATSWGTSGASAGSGGAWGS